MPTHNHNVPPHKAKREWQLPSHFEDDLETWQGQPHKFEMTKSKEDTAIKPKGIEQLKSMDRVDNEPYDDE